MGAVNFSIDPKLVELLVKKLPFDIFVETGTFSGDTIELVKPYFKRIISIEFYEKYYELTVSRFKNDSSVTILKGDSGVVLADLMKQMSGKSILFWLDAHWDSDENTKSKSAQCPVLRELRSINNLNEKSVILIDDARLFLSPPGKPYDYRQWPDLNDVWTTLNKLSDGHKLMIINDIMVYYPQYIKKDLKRFSHEQCVDWLEVMVNSRKHDILIKEVNSKEKEIKNLLLIAEERLRLIEDQRQAIEALRTGFEIELKSFKALAEERESNKEREIKNLQTIAELRLRVIEDQEKALKAFRCRRIKERLKLWLAPRLGVFYQYSPKPIHIPTWYRKTQNPKSFPIISVVTPSFNQADFIERTIKSLLDQNYPKLEYIIQDGGSNDSTLEILKKHSETLSHWESNSDKGQSNAINLGFSHATGEIMAYLNSDDVLLPGALHYIAQCFSKHPDVDVVYGHRVLIDEYDREIGRWVLPLHNDNVLSWADYIPQETLFWRQRIWKKVGGYIDQNFRFAMDWDLILRFREAGAKFVRLPRFLGAFRVYQNQKTSEELEGLGKQEMYQLRKTCHGREVSDLEIRRNIRMYLLKHVIFNKLYRCNLFRY